MHATVRSLFLAATFLAAAAPGQQAAAPGEVTYTVKQTVSLTEVPPGTRLVKWWIAIPDDERNQDLLDIAVTSAPGPWKVVGEPDRGNRFLYVEVPTPIVETLVTEVEFSVRRRAVSLAIDPARVGPLTDSHRRLFAEELRQDAPHMEVTAQIRKMADEACGAETNAARQAETLLNLVADYADHYSKDPSKPNCGVGDAGVCLEKQGGCCTDLHSLFIALARARGIPARLQMGYRLKDGNAGKEIDPGYRCWVDYFLPGYGWVPADIVEADDPKGLGRTRWFSGLTERRVWLNDGREFDLAGRAVTSKRVNTMIMGYAEIDGVEARVLPDGDKKPQLSRKVFFTEVPGRAD